MRAKHITLNSLEEEKVFATTKTKEYLYHVPTYQFDESFISVLRLLYNEPSLIPDKLIELHDKTMLGLIDEKITKSDKWHDPDFPDLSLFQKQYDSLVPPDTSCYHYTKKQLPRLHLLNVLLNYGGTYRIALAQTNYCFFAKKFFEVDSKDAFNITKDLMECTTNDWNGNIEKGMSLIEMSDILFEAIQFFEDEIETNRKFGYELFEEHSQTFASHSVKARDQLLSILEKVRNNLCYFSILASCRLPLWDIDISPHPKQDKKIKNPLNEYRRELSDLYSYYVILWNYLNSSFVQCEERNLKDAWWFDYQYAVQNCYALYLWEITSDYKDLTEPIRTMRYYFANKVFQAILRLFSTKSVPQEQLSLISPYLDTFLNVNYNRAEDTASRKSKGEHSTVSDHIDINNFRDRLLDVQNGCIPLIRGQISIALPLRKNNPYIGCQNLAYLLGVPESYDFINEIIKNPNITPSSKVPVKISTQWPLSINMLSLSLDEDYMITEHRCSGMKWGFLLHPSELIEFTKGLSLLKLNGNSIKDLCAKIKATAIQDDDAITPFDINYFKLFDKMVCDNTSQYYWWFTLPFIHISKVLTKIANVDLLAIPDKVSDFHFGSYLNNIPPAKIEAILLIHAIMEKVYSELSDRFLPEILKKPKKAFITNTKSGPHSADTQAKQ